MFTISLVGVHSYSFRLRVGKGCRVGRGEGRY